MRRKREQVKKPPDSNEDLFKRKLFRFKTSKISEASGIPIGTIRRYKNGQIQPRFNNLVKLFRASKLLFKRECQSQRRFEKFIIRIYLLKQCPIDYRSRLDKILSQMHIPAPRFRMTSDWDSAFQHASERAELEQALDMFRVAAKKQSMRQLLISISELI